MPSNKSNQGNKHEDKASDVPAEVKEQEASVSRFAPPTDGQWYTSQRTTKLYSPKHDESREMRAVLRYFEEKVTDRKGREHVIDKGWESFYEVVGDRDATYHTPPAVVQNLRRWGADGWMPYEGQPVQAPEGAVAGRPAGEGKGKAPSGAFLDNLIRKSLRRAVDGGSTFGAAADELANRIHTIAVEMQTSGSETSDEAEEVEA